MDIIIIKSVSSPNTVRVISDLGANVGSPKIMESKMEAIRLGLLDLFIPHQHQPTESEREFNEQKRLFDQIPPLLLRPYEGLFIASRNGEIVDSDADMDILIDRFFSRYGEVPVYIGRIGLPIREFIDTPF